MAKPVKDKVLEYIRNQYVQRVKELAEQGIEPENCTTQNTFIINGEPRCVIVSTVVNTCDFTQEKV